MFFKKFALENDLSMLKTWIYHHSTQLNETNLMSYNSSLFDYWMVTKFTFRIFFKIFER